MSEAIPTPEKIWIITGETQTKETVSGTRSGSCDIGGLLRKGSSEDTEVVSTERKAVEVNKFKQEMKDFLPPIREMSDEADPPDSKIRLDEVELSVEIKREGEISRFDES